MFLGQNLAKSRPGRQTNKKKYESDQTIFKSIHTYHKGSAGKHVPWEPRPETHTRLQSHFPIYLVAQLGTLPQPNLLISVALLAGNQVALSYPGNQLPQTPVPQLASDSQMPHSAGLILSPASEPFPQKLVDKVKSGQFLEMRALLSDNIAPMQPLEDIQGFLVTTFGVARPRLCEVTSLPTWWYCFLEYMAILMPDPTTRDQLARLIIREVLCYCGQSWRDYDRAFC